MNEIVLPMMVRGGATLNFYGQICQAKMAAIIKFFPLALSPSVHSAVNPVDNNSSCQQNFTYPQLWTIYCKAADFFPEILCRKKFSGKTQSAMKLFQATDHL
jgi:hypothetical protein